MLNSSERQQLLVEWNATQTQYPRLSTLPELFAEQATRTPEAVAVVYEDHEIRYGELDRRANQLAHHLRAQGVGPDVIVGVCLERSVELVIGLLGVLKAGGAYLPLDPQYPAERLAFMLADAQAPVVVTCEDLEEAPAAHWGHVVCLDRDAEQIGAQPGSAPDSGARPDNLAYVIYTSGSTGKPKGVLITHSSIVNSTRARLSRYSVSEATQPAMLLIPPYSFDSSIAVMFWTLLVGGRLVIPRQRDCADPGRISKHIASHGVTHWLSTPSLYGLMLEMAREETSLRCVIVAGEVLSAETVRLHSSRAGAAELHNEYGPTEATVWSTAACIGLADASSVSSQTIPIGRPIANTRVYVLDDELEPVPVGVVGELYIGGVGLARGYLNRPGLSAERFIANPFARASAEAVGERLYRTGDRVRYQSDGSLEYIGRCDHQVKVRGLPNRVRRGGDGAAQRMSECSQAVVVARDDEPDDWSRGSGDVPSGEKRLVAYVVADRNKLKVLESVEYGWLRQETVGQWSQLFDETYEGGARRGIVLDRRTGSHAGFLRVDEQLHREAIAAGEMQEWLTCTVERIGRLGPRPSVGSGLRCGIVGAGAGATL